MPDTDAGLPFKGITQLSNFTSHKGAEAAKERALPQIVTYLQLLHERYPDGLTDAEAAERMKLERTSINARRGLLLRAQLVESHGTRERASSAIENTVWRLRLPETNA